MKVPVLILRLATFMLVPAFFAYLSSTISILDNLKKSGYLGPNFDVELTKQILLVASVLFTSGYLTITNETKNHKMNTILSQRSAFLHDNKTETLIFLETLLDDPHISSVKTRVFKEKMNWSYHRKRLLKIFIKHITINRAFGLAHIEGLSNNDISRQLVFDVTGGSLQGLVGECYDNKEIKYEEDFSLVMDQYNLTSFQRSKYLRTKFWLCAPVINNKGDVVSIISFESIHRINIRSEKEQEVGLAVGDYCTSLYQNFPEMFK